MPKKTEVVKDFPEPEKVSEFLELPFRDGVVTVPREKGKWPTRAILALNNAGTDVNSVTAALLKAMELVLGPVQFDRVADSDYDEFDGFCGVFYDRAIKPIFGV